MKQILLPKSGYNFMGLSTEVKENGPAPGASWYETDTGVEYIWTGTAWVVDNRRKARMMLFNTVTLAWEAATKGAGVGAEVQVMNFPAVISGAEVPVSYANENPTAIYKITDLDTAVENDYYFGYVTKTGDWFIMHLDETSARYFKGSSPTYLANWTGRALLVYDYFNTIF